MPSTLEMGNHGSKQNAKATLREPDAQSLAEPQLGNKSLHRTTSRTQVKVKIQSPLDMKDTKRPSRQRGWYVSRGGLKQLRLEAAYRLGSALQATLGPVASSQGASSHMWVPPESWVFLITAVPVHVRASKGKSCSRLPGVALLRWQ